MSDQPHVTVINNIPAQNGCAGGCGCLLVLIALFFIILALGVNFQ